MPLFDIYFESGRSVRVKGEATAVASAADEENGATILRDQRGEIVVVNPRQVEYIKERQSG